MKKHRITMILLVLVLLFCAACSTKETNKVINGKEIIVSEDRTYLKPESLTTISSSDVKTSESANLFFNSEKQFVEKLKNLDFTSKEEAVVYAWPQTEKGILLCPTDHYYKLASIPEGYILNNIIWGPGSTYGYSLTGDHDKEIICAYDSYQSQELRNIAIEFGATLENVKEFYGTEDVTEKREKRGNHDISIFEIENSKGIMRVETWQYEKGMNRYTIVNLYGTEEMYESRSFNGEYDRNNPISSRILLEREEQTFCIIVSDANVPIDNSFAEQFDFVRTNIE